MISMRCLSSCTLISVPIPLLWSMSPHSPLANDGQLKAHSQGSNQIYSPLIGLEGAGGRAFISERFLLFFFSCLRISLRAGPACGGLSDGQKEELSAEPGVCAEPARDRFAWVNCDGWRCFVWRPKIWLNERMLSTADTGSGKQKGRVKSEISLSSFPHCQHIYSPIPRVQYKTKRVVSCFSCCGNV